MLRTSLTQAKQANQFISLLAEGRRQAVHHPSAAFFNPSITSSTARKFSVANKNSAQSTDSGAKASDSESIFASADYFKDAKIEQDAISADVTSSATETTDSLMEKVDHLMWMDANDSLGTTMALAAKDVDNLVQGVQTYGFSESLVYYESLIWDLWMFFAETQGMGMGLGLIATSIVTRAMFAPIIIYSVSEAAAWLLCYICFCLKYSKLWE